MQKINIVTEEGKNINVGPPDRNILNVNFDKVEVAGDKELTDYGLIEIDASDIKKPFHDGK